MGIFFRCKQREPEKEIRDVLIIQVLRPMTMRINVFGMSRLAADISGESLRFHG